jgi:VanZ family protein
VGRWRLRPKWLLIVYTAFIFVLTHTPPKDLPRVPYRINDKVVHFVMYGGWGFIAGFIGGRNRGFRWLVAGLALALGDELTQPYFGRNLDIWDWFADCLGLMMGYGSVRLIRNSIRLGRGTDVATGKFE